MLRARLPYCANIQFESVLFPNKYPAYRGIASMSGLEIFFPKLYFPISFVYNKGIHAMLEVSI